MTGQGSFDAALAAADEAIARVEEHAIAAWKRAAAKAVQDLSLVTRSFTTDDVHDRLAVVAPDVATHETRALGSIMRAAARDGLIRATDQYRPSHRVECHGRPVRVWASTLYEGREP